MCEQVENIKERQRLLKEAQQKWRSCGSRNKGIMMDVSEDEDTEKIISLKTGQWNLSTLICEENKNFKKKKETRTCNL